MAGPPTSTATSGGPPPPFREGGSGSRDPWPAAERRPTSAERDASPVVQERIGGASPGQGFWLAWPWLALAAGGLVAAVASQHGISGWKLAVAAVSAIGAASAGVWIGERLWHSGVAGLLAVGLWLLAPATLGAAAAPLAMLATALALGAIALFLAPPAWTRWLAGAALFGGALIEPRLALLGLALFPLAVLRGNIYATPQHVGIAFLQSILVPAAAVAVHAIMRVPDLTCQVDYLSALVLAKTPATGGITLLQNPVVHMAGLLAAAALLSGAMVATMRRFRLNRVPGRIQLRLETPLAPQHGRALWLGALLAASPPLLWPSLLAVAAAAGVRELGRDAPGFGIALAVGLVGFALVLLVRGWGLVWGGDPTGAGALDLIPWTSISRC